MAVVKPKKVKKIATVVPQVKSTPWKQVGQGMVDQWNTRNPTKQVGKKTGFVASTPATPSTSAGAPGTSAAGATDEAPPQAPPSYDTNAQRFDAVSGFNINAGDWNKQLRDLALGYGGVDSVEQYSPFTLGGQDTVNTTGVLMNDPLSKVATIGRGLDSSGHQLAGGLNDPARNGLESGNHLLTQQGLNDQAARDREQARRDYDAAVAKIHSLWMGGVGTRNRAIEDANATDIKNFNQTDPQPEANTPMTETMSGPVGADGQPTPTQIDPGFTGIKRLSSDARGRKPPSASHRDGKKTEGKKPRRRGA